MTDSRAPERLGFIHLVPTSRDDPRQGLEDAIELFQFAEELGLDSGWIRTRHMQYGLASPAVLQSAIAQHTSRIRLGNAVIPVGHENPFRLAEDLATADLLSGGRLEPGLSVHGPSYADDSLNDLVFDSGWREQDYTYARIERLRSFLRGDKVREKPEYMGFGGDVDSERVEPHSPGLHERLWYGGGSLRSAEWAGANRFNWLMSNISSTEHGIREFDLAQKQQIETYHGAASAGFTGRVAVARVIVPTDGATDHQVSRYREYVEARTPRTQKVHGKNTIIAMDVLGSLDEILEFIANDAAFQAGDDYLFELPFELELDEWKHMLEQLATRIGPSLGWEPGRA